MDLNEGQKAAVEYGIGLGRPFSPLLIIAGGGTGKTKTLAHRVARLVLNETFRLSSGLVNFWPALRGFNFLKTPRFESLEG